MIQLGTYEFSISDAGTSSSLDPCLCGGESDHPAFGPPATISLHLASKSITPAGSVHKSGDDSVGAVEEMVGVAEGE